MSESPENASSQSSRFGKVRAHVAFVVYLLSVTMVVGLILLYSLAGDNSPWGEYFTIWPPILWAIGFPPLLAINYRRRKLYRPTSLLVLMLLFLLVSMEWRTLLRWGVPGIQPASSSETKVLKVITWNIDSAYFGKQNVLKTMEAQEPDICFLQETPDGQQSFQESDLTGYWSGFHWIDSGDCGTLSRYPLRQLESESVGPWSNPQLLECELSSGTTLLLCNVRLMLPSLVLNPFQRENRVRLYHDNSVRVAQFPRLADLLESSSGQASSAHVILAGDFNTPGLSRSLNPLKSLLRDVWPLCGRGWGGTITADFPVSRIDQCWVSAHLTPLDAMVVNPSLSDHKMLVTALELHN